MTTRGRRPLAEMDAHSAGHVAANIPALSGKRLADGAEDWDLSSANLAEAPLVPTEAGTLPHFSNPHGSGNLWAALRTSLLGPDPHRECNHRLRIPINMNPNQ